MPAMDDAVPRNLVVNHWAVGFLDLLGQRDALRTMDFIPDSNDEAKVAKLIEAIKGSVVVIRRFHQLYDHFRAADVGDLGLLSHLPEDVRRRANEMRNTEVRSLRFSDPLARSSASRSAIGAVELSVIRSRYA